MCVCVCVCVCVIVYVYVCVVCVCTIVAYERCVYAHVCTYARINMYAHTCMYVHVSILECMRAHTCGSQTRQGTSCHLHQHQCSTPR